MFRALLLSSLLLALSCPVEARQQRSQKVLREFRAVTICPSTGRTGRCRTHQIDHRQPLCFYGKDELWNLQYLTIAEHRAKTKLDIKVCGWDSLP